MLTDYDRAWLDAHKQSLQSWTPLILAEFRGEEPERLQRIAADVLVYHNNVFVRAAQLVDAVVRDVQSSQIYEQWNYWCACTCQKFMKQLSAADARAFWYASGFHGQDLEQLEEYAEDGIAEAKRDLYGEEF